ncbi:MAG TPA: hypothetical protein VLC07_00065, partial [Solirubrobacterales bacterium]|nr:hypothetical protein [Solirubrobacterales bacterium]
GSPAYSPAELEEAPANGRKYADIVLGQALPVSSATTPGSFDEGSAAENCLALEPGSAPPEVQLGPGTTRIEVAPGGPASFSLRRFASGEYPVRIAGAEGESTTLLKIPRDRARQPWFLHIEAAQLVRVCR